MILSLLVATSVAGPAHVHAATAPATKQALYDSVLDHFDAAALPGATVDRFGCATVLVQQLKDNWELFDAAEHAELTALVAPWKQDLVEVLPSLPPPPPEDGPEDTCIGAVGAHRYQTTHFSLEWDGDNIDQDDVEDFAEALEFSWETEVEELGWKEPDLSHAYKILVYIDSSNYAGAYTSVERCSVGFSPYIVTGNGIFWGDWYQDLAAHEFNHAIQFAYGYGHEFFYWESTATYIEEQVYPSHNAWSPYISGYTESPWIALNASSQQDSEVFYHMYAMAIFNFYIDEYLGGHDLVRETWEYVEDYPSSIYSLYMPTILEDLGHDWEEAYAGFIAANTVMDYEESRYFGSVSREDWVHELPLHDGATTSRRPEPLGQNFWRISTDAFDADEPDLKLHLEGKLGAEWMVLFVGTTDDRVEEIVVCDEVEGESGEETREGTLTQWDRFEDVWVVMSPMVYDYEESYNYAFDVWSEGPPEPPPEETVDGEGEGGGLMGGCATATAVPGVWVLVGLAGLFWRRRD